jgi:hypothetical protein
VSCFSKITYQTFLLSRCTILIRENANAIIIMVNLTDYRIKDILITHIIPYVGDYQFRFVGSVNRYMYDTYITVFPEKLTKFNDNNDEMIDICIREFRFEKSIENLLHHKDPLALHKFVKRKSKKGQITLLQLAPFMLQRIAIEDIAYHAARFSDYLSMLKWLYWYTRSRYYTWQHDWEWDMIYNRAVLNEDFNLLSWAKKKTNINICTLAVKHRHSHILNWYVSNGWELKPNVCSQAVLRQDGGSIEWARNYGFPLDATFCSNAALMEDLQSLQWARENGCPWDAKTCSNAAKCGNLEIVQWAHTNGCPWDEMTCCNAAMCGNLEILQWVRTNGCPWDAKTCSNAALFGKLEILQWAHINGCPWDANTSINAKKTKQWDIYRWVRSNGCPNDKKKRTYRYTTKNRYVHIVECNQVFVPMTQTEDGRAQIHCDAYRFLRTAPYLRVVYVPISRERKQVQQTILMYVSQRAIR